MLSKRERLSARDISSLSIGKSVFGAHISLRYVFTSTKKFSVSVSKKVAKRAVDRNRIRRRVYSVLRDVKGDVKKSVFVMIMPKKECQTIKLEEIKSELMTLFKKAGLSA